MSDSITLHKVLDGPIDHETTGGENLWSVVYLAEEVDGQLYHEEIFYDDLDAAYQDIKVVNSVVEGLKIESAENPVISYG